MAAGAGVGGKAMQFGRRKAILLVSFIGVIGVLMSLISITNFGLMLTGRLIFGFSNGLIEATVPRYIEEYLPLDYYTFGMLILIISKNVGSALAMYDGLLLPTEYNNPDYIQELAQF
jgi:MFS family permease